MAREADLAYLCMCFRAAQMMQQIGSKSGEHGAKDVSSTAQTAQPFGSGAGTAFRDEEKRYRLQFKEVKKASGKSKGKRKTADTNFVDVVDFRNFDKNSENNKKLLVKVDFGVLTVVLADDGVMVAG